MRRTVLGNRTTAACARPRARRHRYTVRMDGTAATAAKPRDRRLDSLRGVAIVAVVVGHVIVAAYQGVRAAPLPLRLLFTVLTSFHVQLFAFVAGYLTKSLGGVRARAAWIGQRALRLLLPLAAWTTVIWLGAGMPGGLPLLARMLVDSDKGVKGLWFFAALFTASVLFALISWNEPLMVCVTTVLTLAPFTSHVLDLTRGERLLPFLVVGYLAKKHGWRTGWWAPVLYAVGFCALWSGSGANMLYPQPRWVFALNTLWAESGWWHGGTMLLNTLRVAVPLCAIATAFLVARWWQPLAGWGQRSLGIYATHQFFLATALGTGLVAFGTGLVGALLGAWVLTELLGRWGPTALVFLGQPQARARPAGTGPPA